MSAPGYSEAVDELVEAQRIDPVGEIELYFLENGHWFELMFIPEDEETRQFIEGYVKVSTMDTWLDSCEFSSLDVNSMKEWVSEVVREFVCR
jgi:hypothetical protein